MSSADPGSVDAPKTSESSASTISSLFAKVRQRAKKSVSTRGVKSLDDVGVQRKRRSLTVTTNEAQTMEKLLSGQTSFQDLKMTVSNAAKRSKKVVEIVEKNHARDPQTGADMIQQPHLPRGATEIPSRGDGVVADEAQPPDKEVESRQHGATESVKAEQRTTIDATGDSTSNSITSSSRDGSTQSQGSDTLNVPPQVQRRLKPHQVTGVEFLWKHVGNINSGAGCMLADYMGLGKSIQTVATICSFVAMWKKHKDGKVPRVLILAPTSCIRNWMNEFKKWCSPPPHSSNADYGSCNADHQPNLLKSLRVRSMEAAGTAQKGIRRRVVQEWFSKGGVLVTGYEMFRLLVMSTSFPAPVAVAFRQMLADPGPDLIICDEGHRLKKTKSRTYTALLTLRTRRRVVLTGYPFQNHLKEYWTMVNFIRPGVLNEYAFFKHFFETPILNGMCMDSTAQDISEARRRSFVLQKQLEKFVLRRDSSLLFKTLPPKYEWVLHVRMHTRQKQVYKDFLRYRRESQAGGNHNDILSSFHMCRSIINHPDLAYGDSFRYPFADASRDNHQFGNAGRSGKTVVLRSLLTATFRSGEKTVVFSQSIPTLDLLENFLGARTLVDPEQFQMSAGVIDPEFGSNPGVKALVEGQRYYERIDGSTPLSTRFEVIRRFNSPSSPIQVLIVSTKACSEGVNMVGASRVVLFDVCWNPCHDYEAMCRLHRYGQTKPVHVYRLVGAGTMEQKVYEVQTRKDTISKRILDDFTADRKFERETFYFNDKDLDGADVEESAGAQPNSSASAAPTRTTGHLDQKQRYWQDTEHAASDHALAAVIARNSKVLRYFYLQNSIFERDDDSEPQEAEKKRAMAEFERARPNGVVTMYSANPNAPASNRRVNNILAARPPVRFQVQCPNCGRPAIVASSKPIPGKAYIVVCSNPHCRQQMDVKFPVPPAPRPGWDYSGTSADNAVALDDSDDSMESDEDRCVDLTRGRKKPNTSGLSARDVNDLEAQKAALTAAQLEEHNQLLATTKKDTIPAHDRVKKLAELKEAHYKQMQALIRNFSTSSANAVVDDAQRDVVSLIDSPQPRPNGNPASDDVIDLTDM